MEKIKGLGNMKQAVSYEVILKSNLAECQEDRSRVLVGKLSE